MAHVGAARGGTRRQVDGREADERAPGDTGAGAYLGRRKKPVGKREERVRCHDRSNGGAFGQPQFLRHFNQGGKQIAQQGQIVVAVGRDEGIR